jgi:acyl-CoA dehydrogenase
MDRTLFSPEHDLFRQSFRQFIDQDVRPHQKLWASQGVVSRAAWKKAGAAGFLCPWLGEEWGGPGGDFLCSTIVMEELAYAYESGFAMALHSDIIVPYLDAYGNEAQKRRWLPGCAAGDLITALAMTEPGTGSDLAAIKTTAVRDGDDYIINGAKTFISNGQLCDLVIVAAKTDTDPSRAHKGISLVVVEAGRAGFVKGKQLEKMGMAAQDTSELFFEDCRVPVANRLGPEGSGFIMLMQRLQQERLCVAIGSQAAAEQVLKDTIVYTKDRKAFGRPISSFQNTQFKLVECATKVQIGRAFLDQVIAQHIAGKSLVTECSMAKWWTTEMSQEVIDTCLQFFGGYGYMLEYPVARAFMDARVQRIYAGTNEIMKVIIAKQMGL